MTVRPQLVLLLLAAACGPTPCSYEPPLRLADTGLYADFERAELAADVLEFTPQYPLWTDGALKRRWIRLPPGTAIDATDPDAWRFPAGTRLWKELAFERRVETRLAELGPDGVWSYATYLWTADGRDAVLAPDCGVRGAYERGEFRYDVPGRSDCRVCHDGGIGPVLGFSALQLSADRDPLAPNAELPPAGAVDVAELQRRGLLQGSVDPRIRIAARSPRERAAFGHLHANCGVCHNDRGPLSELGLALDWRAERATPGPIASAVDRPSRYRLLGQDSAPSVRVRRGDPERSVLLHRAASRDPLTQMPPLGTRVGNPAAVDLLAAWIREDLPMTR